MPLEQRLHELATPIEVEAQVVTAPAAETLATQSNEAAEDPAQIQQNLRVDFEPDGSLAATTRVFARRASV